MACCAKPNETASCCDSTGARRATDGVVLDASTVVRDVKAYYGETLKSSADLMTSACSMSGAVAPYIKAILSDVPDDVISTFYGCGAPLPMGIEGKRVLDLGRQAPRGCIMHTHLLSQLSAV